MSEVLEEEVIEDVEVEEIVDENQPPKVDGDAPEDSNFTPFNINSFVEENKEPPIPPEQAEKIDRENERVEDEYEKEREESEKGYSDPKGKARNYKAIVEMADTAMSFGLTMLAKAPPSSSKQYRASESYKQQMAEQMALCNWNVDIKPEYMLIGLALMCYGPMAYEAYKTRLAKEKIKKEKGDTSTDSKEIFVLPNADGDYVEVSEEEYNKANNITPSSNASSDEKDQDSKPKKKAMNKCGVCGAPAKNKYCSKECTGKALAYNQNKKKRDSENETVIVG